MKIIACYLFWLAFFAYFGGLTGTTWIMTLVLGTITAGAGQMAKQKNDAEKATIEIAKMMKERR